MSRWSPEPAIVRLLQRVETTSGCWLWQGLLNEDGYARIGSGDRMLRGHRVAYEALVGPIPEGMDLDHLCRNRHCVNPEHLEPVPHKVNVQRGFAARGPRTECLRGHPLDGDNVYVSPASGKRRCLKCHRVSEKARWKRMSA